LKIILTFWKRKQQQQNENEINAKNGRRIVAQRKDPELDPIQEIQPGEVAPVNQNEKYSSDKISKKN